VNVTPASGGAPSLDPEAVRTLASALAGAQRLPSLHYGPVHDTVAVSLEGLAVPAIQNLLQVVEDRLFPAGSPHAESIRTEGHLFVDRLYIRADPVLTQTPDSTVSSARDSAVKAVAHGAHTIEMAGHYVARTPADVNPLAVLAVANEFIATNQLPNYLRAGCCEEVLAARAFVDPADRVVGSGPGRGFVAQARRHCLRDRIGSRRLGDGISGAGGDSVRDHDSGRAGTETGRRKNPHGTQTMKPVRRVSGAISQTGLQWDVNVLRRGAGEPVSEPIEIVRPEKRESTLLGVEQVVELVDAAQNGRRNDLAKTEVRPPAARLHRRVVVQALHRVCG